MLGEINDIILLFCCKTFLNTLKLRLLCLKNNFVKY